MKKLVVVLIIAGAFFWWRSWNKAEIVFVSHADMRQWIRNVPDLKWAILLGKDNLTKVMHSEGKQFNMPTASAAMLKKYVILEGVPTGEERIVRVTPGVYDWLIMLDHDGDGNLDSHLGTLATEIRLDRHEFVRGKQYRVVVGQDTRAQYSVN